MCRNCQRISPLNRASLERSSQSRSQTAFRCRPAYTVPRMSSLCSARGTCTVFCHKRCRRSTTGCAHLPGSQFTPPPLRMLRMLRTLRRSDGNFEAVRWCMAHAMAHALQSQVLCQRCGFQSRRLVWLQHLPTCTVPTVLPVPPVPTAHSFLVPAAGCQWAGAPVLLSGFRPLSLKECVRSQDGETP